MKDVFAVQDEITKKIITALDVKLTRGEWGHIASKGTENLEAYLKSQEAASCADQSTRESLERGRRLSEEAIALDPKFPHAYHVLGVLHMIEALSGFSKNPRESLELANKMQLKAIELDESFAVARAVMGFNLLMLRKYDEAIAETERAYRQAPGSSSVLYWYGTVLTNYGKPQEAVPILREVLRLEPIPMNSRLRSLSAALEDSGQYDEAIGCIKKAIQREPDSMVSQLILTSTYAYAGREEEARASAKEILRINPKFSIEQFMRASPQRDANARERFAQALKIAGLPDKPPLPLPDKPSIAVLPFVNMSDDKSQEYFSDGLTEEIITALSKSPQLFVIASNTTFTYKGKSVKVRQVSEELGVRYVLEGSVRKSGESVRITAQLIDAQKDHHVWSERYERELKDLFPVQDDITMNIITGVHVKLTDGERARIFAKNTSNLQAYLKTAEAQWYLGQFTKESVLSAQRLAEEAIVLDPDYANAYMTLGSVHGYYLWLQMTQSPADSLKRCIELMQKAVSLDESYAEVHALLGYWLVMARQYDRGVAECERAMALDPNSDRVLQACAATLTFAGKREEAIPLFREALRLNPKPPNLYYRHFALALRDSGRYDEAIELMKKLIERNPDDLMAYIVLASSCEMAGREEEARAAAREILRVNPSFSLERLAKTSPHKDQAVVERFIEALRKAGLK